MKAVLSVVIVLFCWYVPSFSAAEDSGTNPEVVRILSLETAWNHAEQQKDTGALDLLLADSLSYVDDDGTFMNRAQFLASASKRSFRAQITAITTHVYGRSAVVTGLYLDIETDRTGPYRRGRSTDTWIKLGDSWQCVSSQSTLITR